MVLAAAVVLLPSCLSNDDDDQWASYKDAAITSFTLGKLNQYLHTTSSQGTDSVYKRTYEGNAYKFYIDQLNGTIYNPDPLPYGTDVAHVLTTVVTKNGGVVGMKSLTSDSLRYFSSSDSLDFRQVRQLYVYSYDGSNYRKYDVHVNVKTTEGDELSWTQLSLPLAEVEDEEMRAVVIGGSIVAKGVTDLAGNGQTAWMLKDGNLLSSTDGTMWNAVGSPAITRLVGATSTKLYAINGDGKLVASTDNGVTWTEEALDSDADLLPTQNISFMSIPSRTNALTSQLVLIGLRDATLFPDDQTAFVWAKMDEQADASEDQPWFFYGTKTVKEYGLPRMSQLQVAKGNGVIIAIGRTVAGKISPIYVSKDEGLTWHADSGFALPDDFAPAGAFALTADNAGNIYLIDGKTGKVWEGK